MAYVVHLLLQTGFFFFALAAADRFFFGLHSHATIFSETIPVDDSSRISPDFFFLGDAVAVCERESVCKCVSVCVCVCVITRSRAAQSNAFK